MYLREITQQTRYIKGIGPKISMLLEKMGIKTVADLLLQFPRDYEDRRVIRTLKNAFTDKKINIIATVITHDYVPAKKRPILKVYIKDQTDTACLVCFGRDYLKNVLVPGKSFFISGIFTYRFGEKQSSNFEVEGYDEESDRFSKIIPVYPLTAGLSQIIMYKALKNALALYADKINDELPHSIREKYNFTSKSADLKTVHLPDNENVLQRAVKHFKYEELFYLQLIMARRSLKRAVKRAVRTPIKHSLTKKLLKRLPFSLTADQQHAVASIYNDIFSPYPMARLLQGDVGCGKTLVALISALSVIEAGEQVVFMAPTELLARQHAEHIALLTEPLGMNIAFLSGAVTGEQRKLLLSALQNGKINLLVGTHALFSTDVNYKKLGLIIIDEQHRFGVVQRKALVEKGFNPDLLLMTATPIPRSLALTVFGDLKTTTIKTKPAGRKPIITHLAREGNEDKVYKRVRDELQAGRQAYFIYPLIQESEKIDLKAAESMYKNLKNHVFKDFKVGLIHSKIHEDKKKITMEEFAQGYIQVLVATSVVEVGVDIANATCMVIEHAEHFGLSQLHQLRGRVGRSNLQSYAFLIYSRQITEDAVKRLQTMMQTDDGFKIAEQDLKIRGPGALLGVEQSGFLKLNIADLTHDLSILLSAREDVNKLLSSDPGLLKPEHNVLRDVLNKTAPFKDKFLESG
ncbi:MAG: ATP-dependent DNA helicase RecG [Spirochaetales bacterium]|nr:ATP-dependent DNA helicase RecG [Spirochaetales bacterium]